MTERQHAALVSLSDAILRCSAADAATEARALVLKENLRTFDPAAKAAAWFDAFTKAFGAEPQRVH